MGQILLKKLAPKIRTVLTKTSKIETEFRTLPIKVIAGEEDFNTRHLEHGNVFEMDFSKVYWNSRLQEEHKDVVDFIFERYGVDKTGASSSKKETDAVTKETSQKTLTEKSPFSVIDSCCGIGPFVVPLCKRKYRYSNFKRIFANDLNPDSLQAFEKNLSLNKIDIEETQQKSFC